MDTREKKEIFGQVWLNIYNLRIYIYVMGELGIHLRLSHVLTATE